MIQSKPQILGYSTDEMNRKLKWLQTRLSLSDTELTKMMKRMPQIMGISILNNMEPKLNWLQQNLYLTDEQLSKMMQQHPPLFGYNIVTNLEPTLDFYIDTLGDKSEALALVTRNPVAFGVSLEKRLMPRLKEARKSGMTIDAKLMNLIMVYTKERWDKKVAKQLAITSKHN